MFSRVNRAVRSWSGTAVLTGALLSVSAIANSADFNVQVGPDGTLRFSPPTINVKVGDTVHWSWSTGGHSVTSGSSCSPDSMFGSSDIRSAGDSYSFTFNSPGNFPYYCAPHCGVGMTGSVKVAATSGAAPSAPIGRGVKQITIPADDRFTPLSLTIHAGDQVAWINNDTDDHTIVSDDVFNKGMGKKLRNVNHVVSGTDNNGGQPGTYLLRFSRPGTFVYHCRFHSHVDDSNQPVAPGPGNNAESPTASGISGNDGGIPNTPSGNYGTPMMGVITILPSS